MLRGCSAVKDIGPLINLADLEVLDLSYADSIRDLTPLGQLPKLTTLWLQSNLETVQRRIPLDLRALVYR